MKEQTMTSINADLKQKAKEKGLNISLELEKALKAKLSGRIDATSEEKICWFCGLKKSETNVLKFYWLLPYEVWACERCDRKEYKKIPIVIGTKRG